MYDKNDIITNQFVRIKHDTVGVGPRFFAHIIDVIIIFFYGFFMIRLYDYLDRGMHFTTQMGLLLGFFFLLLPILTYFIVSETVTGGQTIGKFIMGIKVMKADGTPASMGNYLMRGMLLPVETYGFFLSRCVVYAHHKTTSTIRRFSCRHNGGASKTQKISNAQPK